MKKGFTLVELLVVISIILVVVGIIGGIVNHKSSSHEDYIDWANPEYSRAMSDRRQAEALEEQNALKREELELRKKELEKE